ncbi:MAG TPA: LysR family transcriptional regulator, partial [Usitatibacteraceae bacterium]|nr:LysR family transcriptional regulator [Usitatibacteraceae bacterium]
MAVSFRSGSLARNARGKDRRHRGRRDRGGIGDIIVHEYRPMRGPSMDNLTDIAAFVRVVELGSFTRAADDLDLSKAVVSKYLTRLEERL